jgi:hypothetical protein
VLLLSAAHTLKPQADNTTPWHNLPAPSSYDQNSCSKSCNKPLTHSQNVASPRFCFVLAATDEADCNFSMHSMTTALHCAALALSLTLNTHDTLNSTLLVGVIITPALHTLHNGGQLRLSSCLSSCYHTTSAVLISRSRSMQFATRLAYSQPLKSLFS